MRGGVSMETTQKIGLGLVCVDLVALIAITVMYPALSIIGIVSALYMGFKN